MRDGETEGVMSVKRGRLIQVGPLELDWINRMWSAWRKFMFRPDQEKVWVDPFKAMCVWV